MSGASQVSGRSLGRQEGLQEQPGFRKERRPDGSAVIVCGGTDGIEEMFSHAYGDQAPPDGAAAQLGCWLLAR